MTKKELPPKPDIQPGLYRHYKGGMYQVIGIIGISEADLKWQVGYRPANDTVDELVTWIRPHASFIGTLAVNGEEVLRFQPIDTVE